MDKLNIVSRGFPGTNKTWRFVNDLSNKPLTAIGNFIGKNTIIDGVEVYDDNGTDMVSDGFVTIDGELMPFVQSEASGTVFVKEIIETVDYNVDLNDDSILDNLPAYVTRYATCEAVVDPVNQLPFSSLLRLRAISGQLNTLARGTVYLGNINPVSIDLLEDFDIPIEFPTSVDTANFMVLGVFRLVNDESVNDNSFDWAISNKTLNGFTLNMKSSQTLVGVFFDYYAVNTPTQNSFGIAFP